MDIEELEPRKSRDFQIGCDSSNHGVEELKDLIEALGEEIRRIEETIGSKLSSRDAAKSVFK